MSVGVPNGGVLDASLGSNGPAASADSFAVRVYLPRALHHRFGVSIVLSTSADSSVSSLKALIEVATGAVMSAQILLSYGPPLKGMDVIGQGDSSSLSAA